MIEIISFIACIKGDIAHFLLAKNILEHAMEFMEDRWSICISRFNKCSTALFFVCYHFNELNLLNIG